MRLRTDRQERFVVVGLVLLIAAVGEIAWYFGGIGVLILVGAIGLGVSVLIKLESGAFLLEQVHQQLQNEFRQVEALFSLFSVLKPNSPFPRTRGWAGSPDFLNKISEIVLAEQPEQIVEAGSGVSTLVIGYCLKRLGRGRVIALDHDERFAMLTRHAIRTHGLEAFATVHYCPLASVEISREAFSWYSLDNVLLGGPISFLVVDGPPSGSEEFPRYPALPLLRRHLSNNAVILLDDGSRPGEARTVLRWISEFAPMSSEFLPFEKGAFLLRME